MIDYTFEKLDGDFINYSTYIHWVNNKCTNYLVGRLSFIINPPNNTRWVIEYLKDSLDIVKELEDFNEIPGCDYSNGKLVFEYRDRNPIFVEQRILNPNRPDLEECLKSLGMRFYNITELLDKTNGICSDNRFFLDSREDAKDFYNKVLHYYKQPSEYRRTEEEFKLNLDGIVSLSLTDSNIFNSESKSTKRNGFRVGPNVKDKVIFKVHEETKEIEDNLK